MATRNREQLQKDIRQKAKEAANKGASFDTVAKLADNDKQMDLVRQGFRDAGRLTPGERNASPQGSGGNRQRSQPQQKKKAQSRSGGQSQNRSQGQSQSKDQDFDRRKNGFKDIFDRLTQTPEGRMALLQTSVSLLSGENLAQGIGRGFNQFARTKQAQREAKNSRIKAIGEAESSRADAAKSRAQAQKFRSQAQENVARSKQLGAKTLETLQSIRQGNQPSPADLADSKVDIFKTVSKRVQESSLDSDIPPEQRTAVARKRAQQVFQGLFGQGNDPFPGSLPRLDENGELVTVDIDGTQHVILDPVEGGTPRRVPLDAFRNAQGSGQRGGQ